MGEIPTSVRSPKPCLTLHHLRPGLAIALAVHQATINVCLLFRFLSFFCLFTYLPLG